MRLDNFITKAIGVSRSEAITLIKKGNVSVNEIVVYKKDIHIDENKDIIKFNDALITYKEFIYIMLNKPQGVISATTDKKDKTVVDLINAKRNIFPVGRLDKDTVGLLILTNNGKYAHLSTNPNHHVEKKYYVEVENILKDEDISLFLNGLEIKDGNNEIFKTKPAQLEIISNNSCYVTLTEGKFHQVKRMFEKIDNKVTFLKRVSFGGIVLDESLKYGEYRELTEDEVKLFKKEK